MSNLEAIIYEAIKLSAGNNQAAIITPRVMKAFEDEMHDRTDSQTVSDLQARNDRQYAKIQNLEEGKALLLSDKNQLQAVNNSLRATVDRLKNEGTLVKRNEGLEMLVVELQDRNEELEETTAKVEIANGEMCEAINRLIKERDDASDKSVSLKSMTTARDSLAGQLSDARGELITTNGLLRIERDGEMSSAKASELRNLSTYHMQRAGQMATKLNKIQGILRNP